jgi:hypothetical protein
VRFFARRFRGIQGLILPTSEELLAIGKLVKEGYRTKKGKVLTWCNKHKTSTE